MQTSHRIAQPPALLLMVVALQLTLVACDPAERLCAGFGHPLASDWSTVEAIGDSASFVGAGGNSATLVLASREDSQAYTGTHPSSEARITCRMTSKRRYQLPDGETTVSVVMRQSEVFGTPIDEQFLFLDVAPESPPGSSLGYGFLFNVHDPAIYYSPLLEDANPLHETRHLSAFSAGGTSFSSAVEQIYTDTDRISERAPNANSAITRVVFAKGGGLVEFERLDGEVFKRTGAVRVNP